MTFVFLVGFGIAGIVLLFALMDWYERKNDRGREAGVRGL
jgi:hypothetical protein